MDPGVELSLSRRPSWDFMTDSNDCQHIRGRAKKGGTSEYFTERVHFICQSKELGGHPSQSFYSFLTGKALNIFFFLLVLLLPTGKLPLFSCLFCRGRLFERNFFFVGLDKKHLFLPERPLTGCSVSLTLELHQHACSGWWDVALQGRISQLARAGTLIRCWFIPAPGSPQPPSPTKRRVKRGLPTIPLIHRAICPGQAL